MKLQSLLALLITLIFTSPAEAKVVVVPLLEDDKRKSYIGVSGGWSCAGLESCQDVYEFTVNEPGVALLDVRAVTNFSALRIALYGPDQNLGGTNLLTGNLNDLECSGQNESFQLVHIILPAKGRYKLAIGRDWGSSMDSSGSYNLRFYTSIPHTYHGQTVDDVDSLAANTSCPLILIPAP